VPKQKRTIPQRSHVNQTGVRPGFSRRVEPTPPRSGIPTTWLVVGALGVLALLVIGAYALGVFKPGSGGTPTAAPNSSPAATVNTSGLHPPVATPLANPPAAPAGDGTTAVISTSLGDVEIELFTESSPVAAENFINLANAGFYNGVVFHRLVPDFMIQGGDPEGTGRGGPGYMIQDEPIVGEYDRGIVAMARTNAPNSQGSQFFIIVKDSPFLSQGDYAIFGRVTSGMDVVDQIVGMPTAGDDPGGSGGTALDPVPMDSVVINPPGQ
jgi:peptidyl-prolyl cis-trans isomerase B (cyclophilin B)